jgi:hypothetical protein
MSHSVQVGFGSIVLTAYSARGQLMCHEVCIIKCTYVEDSFGSTWAFDAPAQIL